MLMLSRVVLRSAVQQGSRLVKPCQWRRLTQPVLPVSSLQFYCSAPTKVVPVSNNTKTKQNKNISSDGKQNKKISADENLECSLWVDVLIKACQSQDWLGGIEEVVDCNVLWSEQSLKWDIKSKKCKL